jgi:hypothetical protein
MKHRIRIHEAQGTCFLHTQLSTARRQQRHYKLRALMTLRHREKHICIRPRVIGVVPRAYARDVFDTGACECVNDIMTEARLKTKHHNMPFARVIGANRI